MINREEFDNDYDEVMPASFSPVINAVCIIAFVVIVVGCWIWKAVIS